MMFGREVLLPVDLSLGPIEENTESTALPIASYVEELGDMMKIVHGVARTKMVCASDRQKRGYDHRVNFKSYERGDSVFLFNPIRKKGISPKLQSFWGGPFLVVRKLSDLIYEIQSHPSAKTKIVHHDRLKPCHEKLKSRLKTEAKVTKPQETCEEGLVKNVNDEAFISGAVPQPETHPPQPTTIVDVKDDVLEDACLEEQQPTDLVKETTNAPFVTRSGRVTRKPKYVQQYYYSF